MEHATPFTRSKFTCGLAGDVYLDLPRLGYFLLGKRHGQDSVLIVRFHALPVYRVGQSEGTLEGAVGAAKGEYLITDIMFILLIDITLIEAYNMRV